MSSGARNSLPQSGSLVYSRTIPAFRDHTEDSFPKDRFRTSMPSLGMKRAPFPMRPSVAGPPMVDMVSAGIN